MRFPICLNSFPLLIDFVASGFPFVFSFSFPFLDKHDALSFSSFCLLSFGVYDMDILCSGGYILAFDYFLISFVTFFFLLSVYSYDSMLDENDVVL